ncbi:hypothetical protein ACA910_013042 [Epithemia clementina (nom. ined.)]
MDLEDSYKWVDGDLIALPLRPPGDDAETRTEQQDRSAERGVRKRLTSWLPRGKQRTLATTGHEKGGPSKKNTAAKDPDGPREVELGDDRITEAESDVVSEVAYADEESRKTSTSLGINNNINMIPTTRAPAEQHQAAARTGHSNQTKMRKTKTKTNLLPEHHQISKREGLLVLPPPDLPTTSNAVSRDQVPAQKKVAAVKALKNKMTDNNINNILTVVLVGSVDSAVKSALAQAIVPRNGSTQASNRSRFGLDVQTWLSNSSGMEFRIWDVYGSLVADCDTEEYGAAKRVYLHPTIQSLFFSNDSLYLLLWDLACLPHGKQDHPVVDFAANEEDQKAFLKQDIMQRVLSWVDKIADRAPRSVILPVVIAPDDGILNESEVQRRCALLYELLDAKQQGQTTTSAPTIALEESKTILSWKWSTNHGIKPIRAAMVTIATGSSSSPRQRTRLRHILKPIPEGTAQIREYLQHVGKHPLVRVHDILAVFNPPFPALDYLASVGEILSFWGTGQTDHILSSYIVAHQEWLVSALLCLSKNNPQFKSDGSAENVILKRLGGVSSLRCLVISSAQAATLWGSSRASIYGDSSKKSKKMVQFLERLFILAGIFVPFHNHSDIFYIPSLLSPADPEEHVWGFKQNSYTTTLCNSWLLRDATRLDLFDCIAASIIQDVGAFVANSSDTQVDLVPEVEGASPPPTGRARIHQFTCWKSALLLTIGTQFLQMKSREYRENTVRIFVAIVDDHLPYCVSSDILKGSRVIVGAMGDADQLAKKLFLGGYQAVLDSVQSTLARYTPNTDRHVVCRDCLASGPRQSASSWRWDDVLEAQQRRDHRMTCKKGHRVDTGVLCGKCEEEILGIPPFVPSTSVSETLKSVVMIGLWNPKTNKLRSFGTGFISSKNEGLIVTAAHVLFEMEVAGDEYGMRFWGIEGARVLVGILPGESMPHTAVWRYFAEVLNDGVQESVDVCILRITSRMEKDIDCDNFECDQPQTALDASNMKHEGLSELQIETRCELDEWVRILGFSQDIDHYIMRFADFDRGYIWRFFSLNVGSRTSASDCIFRPRKEIVVKCCTFKGQSGGPCVNYDGKVVGILSRADPANPDHCCYLVPSREVEKLLYRARSSCQNGGTNL